MSRLINSETTTWTNLVEERRLDRELHTLAEAVVRDRQHNGAEEPALATPGTSFAPPLRTLRVRLLQYKAPFGPAFDPKRSILCPAP